MRNLPADVFTISGAGIFLVFGVAYLYKSVSSRHHCSTIRKNFGELNDENLAFLFALMRGLGGVIMSFAITVIYLQLQYEKYRTDWIPFLILGSTSVFFFFSFHSMLMIKRKTTIKPPMLILLLGMCLIIAGFFLNCIFF